MFYKIITKGLVRNFCSEGITKHRKIRSPLVEVFNVKATKGSLDFSKRGGLFNVPELITASGFSEIQKHCVVQTKKLIEEAQNAERTRKMVEIFDEMSDSLCRVADLAEFIRIAHPSPKFRAAAEETCLSVSEIVEHLNTNRKLYDNLKESLTVGDVTATTEVDNLVGQLFLFDFEQNGIHLSEDLRNKVVMLNNAILNLGQRFVAASDLPRIVKKSVIPSSVQGSFNSEGDNIIVSGLSVDSPNAMVRELAYKIYYYPDKQQALLLENLIQHRLELANICGFKSYAERVLRGGTIDNTSDVISFLEITSNDIKQFSNSDFKLMNKMKRADNFEEDLAIWDVPYYVTKAKRNWFSVKQEEYCPYFSLGACMDGLNIIFENLYGISLVNCPVMEGECWSSDVYKLAVVHETEGTLGYIYCDFYERIGKPNQDCHFTIRGGKELNDGSYQVPIAVLLLNFRSPTWGTPSLLTPHNVDNLFHEMGHAMHSMLARTKYQHVTGTRCSTDFAEVPSVLMEYFASDPRIIKLFARHYETNAPIPEEMLQRLCASKKVFTACETKMQIFYSVLDQLFHSEDPYSNNVPEAVAAIQEQYYGLQYVPNTAWHLRFSHLVGYGAKYYSYLVSRSVAHSIWHNHFQSDPLNRKQGENYRRDCLAHGGGKNPKKLVADFLKIEPSPKVLANSLVTDISENYKEVEKCCYSHNI